MPNFSFLRQFSWNIHFLMKIRFENSNILRDFYKIDNFEGSNNPKKSKFQDLLHKIFR